ncbi:MAG: 50S ribosomal protein L29 [Chroococcidiopsidaceae cyanobacterium CP_BM_RX_35]|nr:50S ribosomal protein L29 [Chroococcidiopsidaceae cyanobacterium CP_BM_RX_35]
MALPKIEEARDLSDAELDEQILAIKRQLFQLRLQKATRQLDKPHQFKHAKHRLAQLLTVEHERKQSVAASQENQSVAQEE